MPEKVSFIGFSVRIEMSSLGITVLAGTQQSFVACQTQLSLVTEILIRTSNP